MGMKVPPQRKDRTAAERPAAFPWEADLDAILERHPSPDVARVEPGWLRAVLTEAWQFGYTSGMADSAKIEQVVRDHVLGQTLGRQLALVLGAPYDADADYVAEWNKLLDVVRERVQP